MHHHCFQVRMSLKNTHWVDRLLLIHVGFESPGISSCSIVATMHTARIEHRVKSNLTQVQQLLESFLVHASINPTLSEHIHHSHIAMVAIEDPTPIMLMAVLHLHKSDICPVSIAIQDLCGVKHWSRSYWFQRTTWLGLRWICISTFSHVKGRRC